MKTPLQNRPSGFTLLELMVVIGIMAIALGFAVPAFQSIGRGTALTSSGNTLTSLAASARQNSASKNVLTAMVVLTGTGTEADYRTVGLYEFGTAGFWQQIGKWENLPTGIVIDAQDRANGTFLEYASNLPRLIVGGESSIRYMGKAVPPESFAARIFVPSGGLSNPDKPAQLRLVEGFFEAPSTIQYMHRDSRVRPSELLRPRNRRRNGRDQNQPSRINSISPMKSFASHQARRRRFRFSLTEVAIAIGVVSVSLVALLGLTSSSIQTGKVSADETTMTTAGQEALGILRSRAFGTLPYEEPKKDDLLTPPKSTVLPTIYVAADGQWLGPDRSKWPLNPEGTYTPTEDAVFKCVVTIQPEATTLTPKALSNTDSETSVNLLQVKVALSPILAPETAKPNVLIHATIPRQ